MISVARTLSAAHFFGEVVADLSDDDLDAVAVNLDAAITAAAAQA
jgi:hypothetical protein